MPWERERGLEAGEGLCAKEVTEKSLLPLQWLVAGVASGISLCLSS